MKTLILIFVCSAIICSVGIDSSQANLSATRFTSAYTDLNRECKDAVKQVGEGQDMPLRCKGYGGYYIYIYYSAWASQIAAQMQRNEDVSIPLAVQALNYSDEKGRKIEWRMADGVPFAVILRVSKYISNAGADGGNPFDPKHKTGESLLVKGLKGYEKIDFEVDVKTTPNPNERARQLADENYQK